MENEENELMVQEDDEMLEQTNETENTETQTVEENVENVEVEENTETKDVEEKTEEKAEKKSLAEILKENPELQEEYNNSMKKRLNRQKDSLSRQYGEKYGKLENILKTGLNTDNIDDATSKLEEFYKEQGINIPSIEKNYSDKELQILAKAEADEIIELGYDEIVDEVDRLVSKGVDNMTLKEKLIYKELAEKRNEQERKIELEKIGAKQEILNSKEFKEYSSMFNEKTPITKVYEMYTKSLPKPEVEQIGDLSNQSKKEDKSFYTPEEVDRLTEKDYENPEIFKKVRASMLRWKN